MLIKEYKELDGIKYFHENVNEDHDDYNSKGLDNLYAQEEKHFWFIARKEFILQNALKYVKADEKILEVGAGTGNVSRFLQSNGYSNISVGEMHLNGLKYAKSYGMKDCYMFDLLDTPFEEEFDAVCMFDVLEHIAEDSKALKNVNQMLKKDGKILLTVPSHMWLWHRGDAVAAHKIRYTKKELINILRNNGFEILTARYFFISILPLLFIRRMINKDDGSKVREEEYTKGNSMNSFLSSLLLLISRIENKLNRFLPNAFGGSLFVIAKKNDSV